MEIQYLPIAVYDDVSVQCMSISVCVILHMSVITQKGYSALMLAAMEGKTEVVVELVKAGANVDMQTEVCQYIYVPHDVNVQKHTIICHTYNNYYACTYMYTYMYSYIQCTCTVDHFISILAIGIIRTSQSHTPARRHGSASLYTQPLQKFYASLICTMPCTDM